MSPAHDRPRTAFVLGGGGHLGAYEVGMLRALMERDIVPDLVVGSSVGALNGAMIAARPTLETVSELESIWTSLATDPALGGSLFSSAAHLMRSRTALHSGHDLDALIHRSLPVRRFEELEVPFQCVAANIERAEEHWFATGELVPAILASTSVPGLLPVVEIDGDHYMDGGLVNSIPLERAFHLGATQVYVLHVGRIEQRLSPPKTLLQVALVSFEIARRSRFARDLASCPEGVELFVLPSGEPKDQAVQGLSRVRGYRDVSDVATKIQRAHRATLRFLSQHGVD